MPANVRKLTGEVIENWFWAVGFKSNEPQITEQYHKIALRIKTCGRNFVHLEDNAEHIKINRMRCKNEFCPECGQNNSALHKKRVSRATGRLFHTPVLGYMVFTLPDTISELFPDKKVLSKLSKHAWQVSNKYFDTDGGMSQVHLMGDKPGKLHIHFNVLFPVNGTTGKVDQAVLDELRTAWTAIVNKEFGLSLPTTSVYYKFAVEEGRKLHKVKYVLRPIVTPDKFLSLPDDLRKKIVALRGWKNTRWFGKLSHSQYKKYFQEKSIAIPEKPDTLCPVSKEKYHYVDVISSDDLGKGFLVSGESGVHQIRAIDNDTWVDLETYSYMQANGMIVQSPLDRSPP